MCIWSPAFQGGVSSALQPRSLTLLTHLWPAMDDWSLVLGLVVHLDPTVFLFDNLLLDIAMKER